MSVQSFFLWREIAGSFTVQKTKFCRSISGGSLGVQQLRAQAQSMRNMDPMLLVWLEYRNMPETPLDITVTHSAASPVTGTSFFKPVLVFRRHFTSLYLTRGVSWRFSSATAAVSLDCYSVAHCFSSKSGMHVYSKD
jgi:hypothetical protein